MTERISNASPQLVARISGACYLLMALSGGLAMFARHGLIVTGDAAATAAQILAHQAPWLLGFAGDLMVAAFYVVVTALFYQLFKPVDRSISLLAAYFSLAGCIILGLACSFELAPFVILGDAPYMAAFKLDQLQALSYMFLKLYSYIYGVSLVFFGFFDVLIGYLVFRSTFLPRFIGVLMAIAGLAGLAFLSPLFGISHIAYLMPLFVGEGVLIFWLIFAGVNVAKWHEKSRASQDGILGGSNVN